MQLKIETCQSRKFRKKENIKNQTRNNGEILISAENLFGPCGSLENRSENSFFLSESASLITYSGEPDWSSPRFANFLSPYRDTEIEGRVEGFEDSKGSCGTVASQLKGDGSLLGVSGFDKVKADIKEKKLCSNLMRKGDLVWSGGEINEFDQKIFKKTGFWFQKSGLEEIETFRLCGKQIQKSKSTFEKSEMRQNQKNQKFIGNSENKKNAEFSIAKFASNLPEMTKKKRNSIFKLGSLSKLDLQKVPIPANGPSQRKKQNQSDPNRKVSQSEPRWLNLQLESSKPHNQLKNGRGPKNSLEKSTELARTESLNPKTSLIGAIFRHFRERIKMNPTLKLASKKMKEEIYKIVLEQMRKEGQDKLKRENRVEQTHSMRYGALRTDLAAEGETLAELGPLSHFSSISISWSDSVSELDERVDGSESLKSRVGNLEQKKNWVREEDEKISLGVGRLGEVRRPSKIERNPNWCLKNSHISKLTDPIAKKTQPEIRSIPNACLGPRVHFFPSQRQNVYCKRVKREIKRDLRARLGSQRIPEGVKMTITLENEAIKQSDWVTEGRATQVFKTGTRSTVDFRGVESDRKIESNQTSMRQVTEQAQNLAAKCPLLLARDTERNLSGEVRSLIFGKSSGVFGLGEPRVRASTFDILENSDFGVEKFKAERKAELGRILRNILANFSNPGNPAIRLRNLITFTQLQVAVPANYFRELGLKLKTAFCFYIWFRNVPSKLPFQNFRRVFGTATKLTKGYFRSLSKR